jgi:hypothetical protein
MRNLLPLLLCLTALAYASVVRREAAQTRAQAQALELSRLEYQAVQTDAIGLCGFARAEVRKVYPDVVEEYGKEKRHGK